MKTQYLMLDTDETFAINNVVAIRDDGQYMRFYIVSNGEIYSVSCSSMIRIRENIKNLIVKHFFEITIDSEQFYTKRVYINKHNVYSMLSHQHGIRLKHGGAITFDGNPAYNVETVRKKIVEYLDKVKQNVIKK